MFSYHTVRVSARSTVPKLCTAEAGAPRTVPSNMGAWKFWGTLFAGKCVYFEWKITGSVLASHWSFFQFIRNSLCVTKTPFISNLKLNSGLFYFALRAWLDLTFRSNIPKMKIHGSRAALPSDWPSWRGYTVLLHTPHKSIVEWQVVVVGRRLWSAKYVLCSISSRIYPLVLKIKPWHHKNMVVRMSAKNK